MRIGEDGSEIPDPPKPPVEPVPAPIQPSPDPIEQKPVPKSPDLIQPDAPQVSPYFSRPPQLSAPAESVAPEPPSPPASPQSIVQPDIPASPPSSPPPGEPDPSPTPQPLPPPFTYAQPPSAGQPSQSDSGNQGMPPMMIPPGSDAQQPESGSPGPSQPKFQPDYDNPAIKANLSSVVNDLQNQVKWIISQLKWLEGVSNDNSSHSPVRYGVAKTTWSSGNTIVVTPCFSATNNTFTGDPEVTVYIDSPSGAVPKKIVITAGDILAFTSLTASAVIGNLLPVLVKFDSVTTAADPTTSTAAQSFDTATAVTGLTTGSLTGGGSATWNGSCDGNGNMTGSGTVTVTIGGAVTGASGTATVLKSVTASTAVVTGFSNTPLVLRAPSGW